MGRGRKRSPKLTAFDRFFFGLVAFFVKGQRLDRLAVILKPATILKFHKALVKRKYKELYSNKGKMKPGRKGPHQELMDLVIEMKKRNPRFGYGKISMQIYHEFGILISRFAVGRILRKYFRNNGPCSGDGPSWLTFIGHMKDSLWSLDLFKCESIFLKTHWVMVVMDQFTRRIIGFSVSAGDYCDGAIYCRLFNKIILGKPLPKRVSTDNDPLFEFHRWKANLRILEIDEIKTVPGVPISHPFIERLVGSVRREFLDHMLFFSEYDLQTKLDCFQAYYNESRAHSSLEMKTPQQMADYVPVDKKVVSLDRYRWESHCKGLFTLPIAA